MLHFYHVQRHSAGRFKPGRSYTFGKEHNHHFNHLCGVDLRLELAGVEDKPVDAIIADYLDAHSMGYFRRMRAKGVSPDEKGLFLAAGNVLRHQAMLLREFVFEQVRQESFPGKPSRLRCIWLIPHDEQLLAQWCATAPGQCRAFEVEAAGNFHHGRSRYLKPESVGVPELRIAARRYWTEQPTGDRSETTELLCEGEIKVIREIHLPGSRPSVWNRMKQTFA